MNSRHSRQRRGRTTATVIGVVSVVAIIAALVFVAQGGRQDDAAQSMLMHTVARSDFEAFITEPGDVSSSSNVEIRCKVKAPGAQGTAILKICDEGTHVKKGDFLVQFDDSQLQQEVLAQRIVVAKDKAAVIDAQSEYDKAVQALAEYKDGLFLVDKETYESELFQAEANHKSAQEMLAHTQRMFRKGFVSKIQLDAERLSVEMAKKATKAAKTKLRVLNEFTLKKKVKESRADIEKQQANVEAARFTLELSQKKLKLIQAQIDACIVRAPSAGQVVYANERDFRNNNVVIEEGSLIRENQIIIRLPDLKNMQVEVKVNEAFVNRIKPGQKAVIELDADPENLLYGKVKEVAAYPFPIRWHGAPIEFGAKITIINPPTTIRPGLRAKVKIVFDSHPDVLQVPLASVIEHHDQYFCLIRDTNNVGWKPVPVKIGSNNNSQVVITEGLAAGDEVSITPFRHIERADLPGAKPNDLASKNDRKNTKKGRNKRAVSGKATSDSTL